MDIKWLKKTFVLQQGLSDCGAACLASLIQFYGGEEKIENIRKMSGTNRQGTTLLGLLQAASHLGFDAEGLEAKGVVNLKELSEPAILHIITEQNLQHYIVFYGIKNANFIIGDPAEGIVHYTPERLKKLWVSKTLLKINPNKDFVKKSVKRKAKWEWFVRLIREDTSILLTALFLGVIITVLGLSTAIFSQQLIDEILPKENIETLILGIVLLALILLAKSGLTYIRGFLLIKQSKELSNRIMSSFYSSLLNLQKLFFDSRKTGELIARMNDTQRIQTTVSIVIGNAIIDLLIIIISSLFVFIYSAHIGVMFLTCFLFYLFLISSFSRSVNQSQQEVMRNYALNESNFINTIQGIADIKTTNSESVFSAITFNVYSYFQEKVFNLGKLNIRYSFLSETIGVLFMVAIFAFSSYLVINENLHIGEMFAVLTLASNIIPSINRLVISNIHIQEAKVAFERMYEFTSVEKERLYGGYLITHFEKLKVDNLCFRFAGRKRLLDNISFNILRGEFIVLLGESGSGKSTLLQILQRFYEPESGDLRLNNEVWQNISVKSWRDIIGVVHQDIKIFDGPLWHNVSLSDKASDIEKVECFCSDIGFDEYFRDFPQKYHTLLGEGGVNISGGQKQIVALARALYRKPQLLLLDEPTAAIDRRTENVLINTLLKLRGEITILLVTHNIKTARKADRIYLLDNGRIQISGTPAELLLSENLYSEFYKELMI